MKIKTLRLTNFSIIREGEFNFSPNINVFLGRNGAGKSHLLKLLYSILRARRESSSDPTDDDFGATLKQKLAGVFRPDEEAVGRLVSRGIGRRKATIHLEASRSIRSRENIGIKFTLSTLGKLLVNENTLPRPEPSVFLPSREVLAMYEGFVQAYEERELSFDETYRDLCIQLSGAQLRGPRLEAVSTLAKPLEEVLGGAIRLEGGRFFRAASGGNLEAHLLSEGLRKIGSLTHLVLNGSLIKNGFLIWDEPETSLNPRLVTVVAQTLRHLAGFGIQIFIATHDFLLLNELALIDDFQHDLGDSDPIVDVKFFGLNLASDQSYATVESASRLRDLRSNDILDEFAAYYDRRSSLAQRQRRSS